MRTDFQYVLVRLDDGVCTIALNRPEVLNAFNDPMLQELTETVEIAAQDDAVRCVVLTGAGRAFGSGQDLAAFSAARSGEDALPVREHLKKYHRLILALQSMQKPTLAAVRGVAAGISCNIALACDLRIATENARFIEAFARIGLVPDGGGAYFLPRLIGFAKAMEMALLANEITGIEAERIGLINKCVPEAEFEAATAAFAQRLAHGPTRTYGLMKKLLYTSLESDLQSSLDLEAELQEQAMQTADHHEGVAAFIEKRAANYSGQ
ncbi:MAG TPA: enoyl-CoA hydratase-related protein [Ktedonobacteraceae bacterium]|jgi:2-(1,2-epoxy-1,2-dihydrophenyl)acetyl-CoA isomerase|nr:enoyl-CoA hydratase-related protein [Ktedonobacteraceae bacterium]